MVKEKKTSLLKIFMEPILGFIILLILPIIVFVITSFSMPLGLAIILFILQIKFMVIIERIKEVKEIRSKKEFFQIFNMQKN